MCSLVLACAYIWMGPWLGNMTCKLGWNLSQGREWWVGGYSREFACLWCKSTWRVLRYYLLKSFRWFSKFSRRPMQSKSWITNIVCELHVNLDEIQERLYSARWSRIVLFELSFFFCYCLRNHSVKYIVCLWGCYNYPMTQNWRTLSALQEKNSSRSQGCRVQPTNIYLFLQHFLLCLLEDLGFQLKLKALTWLWLDVIHLHPPMHTQLIVSCIAFPFYPCWAHEFVELCLGPYNNISKCPFKLNKFHSHKCSFWLAHS